MRHLLPGIALICCINTPAWSETIPGADDPAFRLPFERALQGDDPTALQDLYTAAENGNEAALRALPTVLNWLPPKGSLAEKKRYRAINGVPLDQAVAAVSPVAAAWNSGKGIEAGALDERAKTLAGAGEIGKAQALYQAWTAYVGLRLPIPLETADPPPALFLLTAMLGDRLLYANDPADNRIAAKLLREDRLEGWMVLATLFFADPASSSPRPDISKAAEIIAMAKIHPDLAVGKMKAALAVREWLVEWVGTRDPQNAEKIAAMFRGRPEFAPVEAYCHTTCPATTQACEAAWLFLSAPYSVESNSAVPEIALMSTEAFFASPRGVKLIFPQATIGNFAAVDMLEKFLISASKLDSCLSTAARASTTIP